MHRPNKKRPAAKGSQHATITDGELMSALRQLNPQKYGVVPTAPNSADRGKAQNIAKGLDVDIDEMCAAATCSRADVDAADKIMRSATGVKNTRLATRIVNEANQLPRLIKTGSDNDEFFATAALLQEIQPENALQAMLATQIIGVHNAAMKYMRRAFLEGQTLDGAESCMRRVASLGRLFLEQIDAMRRLKGTAGLQRIVVERIERITAEGGGKS